MHPGKQIPHEVLGKAFGLVETLEKEAAEELHDSRGIQGRKREELPFRREHAIGNQGMGVGIPIRIGAEGLQRNDAAGADIGALKQRLEGFQDRRIGGLGKQPKQLAVVLEQAAQYARDRKNPMVSNLISLTVG